MTKTFLQLVKEQITGKEILDNGKGFVSIKLSKEQQDQFHALLKEFGIKDPVDEMHVTLAHDKRNPNVDIEIDPGAEYKAEIVDLDVMGEGKWKAIVLKLHSQEMIERHNHLRELGYHHTYPQFIPHVSLKYKPTDQDIEAVKDKLDVFKKHFPMLIFNDEQAEKIEE